MTYVVSQCASCGQLIRDDGLCGECATNVTIDRDEAASVVAEHIGHVLGYIATCRRNNTREWMFGLEDTVNRFLAAIGDKDRLVCDSDGMGFWIKRGGTAAEGSL